MRRWGKTEKILAVVYFYLFFCISTLGSASAMTQSDLEKFWNDQYAGQEEKNIYTFTPTLEKELLAKASPDEFYTPQGASSPIPKVNQGYVWAMAKSGDWIWFGTVANTQCLVLGSFFNLTTAFETNDFACEFEDSALVPGTVPAQLGDWRAPEIYRYNTQTKVLENMTPSSSDPSQMAAYNLINQTLGVRSAGTVGDTVILAGPALNSPLGINLFSYSVSTGALQWAGTWMAYSEIRKWLTIGNDLYAAVSTPTGGAVVKWKGNGVMPELVGILGSRGAEIVSFEGRIFVGTWPIGGMTPEAASIYMSPTVPTGGLTTAHQNSWTKVWDAHMYEPDPVIAMTYGTGAMEVFGDSLYWGTMHVPLLSHLAAVTQHGITVNSELDAAKLVLGAWRAVSIFRGKNFGTSYLTANDTQKVVSADIELLYGLSHFPVYNDMTGDWEIAVNNMGLPGGIPKMGLAGFGNPFNIYTWSMGVFGDKLFIGSMDMLYMGWSFVEKLISIFVTTPLPPINFPIPPETFFGADLWRLDSTSAPYALPESINGVVNYLNYGVRNMLGDDALYLGMANPMNLRTDPGDDKPEGGWELVRLYQDMDKDGYSDQDEMRYGSDKNNPNSIPVSTLNGGVTVSSYSGDVTVRSVGPQNSGCMDNPPNDIAFGMIDFEVTGIPAGATVTVVLDFSVFLTHDTQFYKCDPTAGPGSQWTNINHLVNFTPGNHKATITVTDNVFPDTNMTPGVIGDPIGISMEQVVPVPVLGSSALIVLAVLLSIITAAVIRRKRSRRES